MMDALLAKAATFGERYEREIQTASFIWLMISGLAWIPQIPIPDIPYLTDRNSWMLSGAWAVFWWCFAHPLLAKKRKEMEAADNEAGRSQIEKE